MGGFSTWASLKRKVLTPEREAKIRKEVQAESRAIRLRQLRELFHMSQEQLAAKLGKTQESLSKLENRKDFRISSLIAFVEALGGEVRVSAFLPDGEEFPIELPVVKQSPTKNRKRTRKAA